MDKESILVNVKALNKKILRHIEIEFESLREENDTIDNASLQRAFKRIRSSVLDDIGSCSREIEKLLDE